MISYFNLPSAQRRTQQIADQFNADEQLWESLKDSRIKGLALSVSLNICFVLRRNRFDVLRILKT